MASYSEIKKRREKISTYLVRGVLSPVNLAQVTGIDVETVKNDLKFFRKDSGKWLSELAKDGYTFQAQNTSDQLQDMIEELQAKRTEKNVKEDTELLIKVDTAIAQLLSLKFQLSMSGPGLMSMQQAMNRVATEVR